MDLAPGGSCRGVRQWEQFTSIGGWNIVIGGWMVDGEGSSCWVYGGEREGGY